MCYSFVIKKIKIKKVLLYKLIMSVFWEELRNLYVIFLYHHRIIFK